MISVLFVGSLLLSSAIAGSGWTELSTTWSAVPFQGFYSVPLTLSAVKSKGWNEMLTCKNDPKVGYLYAENGDLSSMPFYNSYGQIYGIMLGMTNPGKSSEVPPFNSYTLPNGTKFWGVQAYFRDPTTVCSSAAASKEEKVGDRLWFRNGNTFYKAPLMENSTILDADGWLKGGCFVGMGVHYWRYMSVDMNCNNAYPLFLLYSQQKLAAWGVAMVHDDRPYLTSYRWEHPSGDSLKLFFESGDMPTCLPNQGTLSTQHVYMTNPLWDNCLGEIFKIF